MKNGGRLPLIKFVDIFSPHTSYAAGSRERLP